MKTMRNFLAAAGVAFAAVAANPASAATMYDLSFTGSDGAGAVTANLLLDVVGTTVVGGTGTVTQTNWGTASMAFLSSPTLNTVYQFNHGTDLYADDNSFPVDGNGLVFNVGTAATPGSQYQTGGAFNIWSNGGNSYGVFLADTVNGATLWEELSGTGTVTQVSAVPLPGALSLFGTALVGVGAVARRRARKGAPAA